MKNPQSWSVERQAGRVCQRAVTEVRTGPRPESGRHGPYPSYISKEWLPAQRETLWAVREPSLQLQTLLKECSKKGQLGDLPVGSVVKTLSSQYMGAGVTLARQLKCSTQKPKEGKKEKPEIRGLCQVLDFLRQDYIYYIYCRL